MADSDTQAAPQTTQPQQSERMKALIDLIGQVGKMYSGMQAGGGGAPGGVVSPGTVGGTPPQMAGGLPSVSSLPTAPGPIALATANQPGPRQAITPGPLQTGMEFRTHAGRAGAVAAGAISTLSQFVSQARRQKDEKTRAQAENYMSQIMAAQAAGDQETLNLLLSDPKVIKTLEKGLNYIFEKMQKEPEKAPPPEAVGLTKAVRKAQAKAQQGQRLPLPNTPGGVIVPRMDPVVAAQRQAAMAEAQKKTQQAVSAPVFSPEEARDIAMIQGGLKPSADAVLGLAGKMMDHMSKGFSLQVHGDVPVAKGPDGKEYIYGDPNAPPDAKALLQAAHASQQAAWRQREEMAARSQAAAFDRFMAVQKRQDRKQAMNIWKDSFNADMRITRMKSNLQKALGGDQQAMVSIASDHAAMTLRQPGAGTMRVVKAQWDELQQSAPFLQRVEAHFDDRGYLTGLVLTPDQMRQMIRLGEDIRKDYWVRGYQDSILAGLDGVPQTAPGLDPVLPGQTNISLVEATKSKGRKTPPAASGKGPFD